MSHELSLISCHVSQTRFQESGHTTYVSFPVPRTVSYSLSCPTNHVSFPSRPTNYVSFSVMSHELGLTKYVTRTMFHFLSHEICLILCHVSRTMSRFPSHLTNYVSFSVMSHEPCLISCHVSRTMCNLRSLCVMSHELCHNSSHEQYFKETYYVPSTSGTITLPKQTPQHNTEI